MTSKWRHFLPILMHNKVLQKFNSWTQLYSENKLICMERPKVNIATKQRSRIIKALRNEEMTQTVFFRRANKEICYRAHPVELMWKHHLDIWPLPWWGGGRGRSYWEPYAFFSSLLHLFIIISAHVVKICDLVRSKSGHQATSKDLISEKFECSS